jgi:DNA-binding HxlR family transcriptional regulator
MRWEDLGDQQCSVARALAVFGDRWTLLILRDCFGGIRRFDDFLQKLNVSRTILTDRLNKLVEHGVLEKVPYQTRPTRFDYRLTQKGHDLYPVIATIVHWGDSYYAEPGREPILLVHKGCGKVTQARVVCSECGETLTARTVRAELNPALKDGADQTRKERA